MKSSARCARSTRATSGCECRRSFLTCSATRQKRGTLLHPLPVRRPLHNCAFVIKRSVRRRRGVDAAERAQADEYGGRVGCTAQGPERTAGADRRAVELGPNRSAAEPDLCGERRSPGVSAAGDGAGAAVATMVFAVGPGTGRGAQRPAELSALRGTEPGRGSAGPLDPEPLPFAAGQAWAERARVRRDQSTARAAWPDGQARDADRRDAGCGQRGAAADTESTPGEGSELDPDADWTQRKGGGGSHFGYKAHVAVDQGSGLIRKALLTSAKVNDSEVADALICGDEQTVYADKAYDPSARRELLAAMGIGDGIMRRARWGTARNPEPELVARNASLSPIRSAVERSFAAMKQWYGYRRVRYRGLARNALQLHLMCIAINLRRALVLHAI